MRIQLLRSDVTSMKLDAMVSPPDAAEGPSLFCRFVIPTSAPAPDEPGADEGLRAATGTSLDRAESFAVASVGLAPLWTAPAAAERCARNMLQATIEFRSRARSVQQVVYCLWGKVTYDLFERVLRDLES